MRRPWAHMTLIQDSNQIGSSFFFFYTESQYFAKCSPTEGKHGARQQAAEDRSEAGGEQRGGRGGARGGLQGAPVPQDPHGPGGDPEPPTSG